MIIRFCNAIMTALLLACTVRTLAAQEPAGTVASAADDKITVALNPGNTVEAGTEGLVYRIFEFRDEKKKIEYARVRVTGAEGATATCIITEKLMDRGITPGLLVEFRVARSFTAQDPEALEKRAHDYYAKNDLRSAMELYKRILQSNPFHSDAKQMVAKIEKEMATGGSQELVAKVKYWTEQAQAASDDGNFDEAAEAYSNAIKLDPGNASLYVNRGISFRKSGRHEAAVQDYTRALELEQTEITYLYRGMAYSLQQKYKNAIDDFEKALSLNAGLAEAHFQMGNTYVRSGEYTRAARSLSTYLKMEPRGKNADEAERLLKSLAQ